MNGANEMTKTQRAAEITEYTDLGLTKAEATARLARRLRTDAGSK